MANQIWPYMTLAQTVKAIKRLELTPSGWNDLPIEEREILRELFGNLSNSLGELQKINPKRWK